MTDTPLPTQDILGVELVRAGGPFKGTGSAKGGDYITPEQLAAAAASSVELREELRAPVKLGHNDAQQGLAEAGLFGTDGAPAAGWVDNLRVEGDRLLADLRAVPRVVADLVKAGAYRARSIEFWRGYTDARGKQHPMVITGLALLGAKLPAVRGLKDIVALYAGDVPPGVEQVTYTVTTGEDAPAETDEVSDGDSADGTAAGPTDGPTEGTDAPLIQQEGDDREHMAAAPRNREDGGNMPDTITPELSTALGLSQEADMAAVEAKVTELSQAAQAAEELRVELGAARERIATLEQDDKGETRLAELAAEVEALRGLAQDGVDAAKELASLRKDRLFAEALESKRITPGQADKLREQYDAAPEAITSVIATLEPRTDLSSELEGEDGKGEAAGADDDAQYAQVWGEAPRETITTPAVSGQEG